MSMRVTLTRAARSPYCVISSSPSHRSHVAVFDCPSSHQFDTFIPSSISRCRLCVSWLCVGLPVRAW